MNESPAPPQAAARRVREDKVRLLSTAARALFYGFNGIDLDAPDDDAYHRVIAVDSGTATYQEVSASLASWH